MTGYLDIRRGTFRCLQGSFGFEGLLIEHFEEVHCSSRIERRMEQGGEGGVPWLGKLKKRDGGGLGGVSGNDLGWGGCLVHLLWWFIALIVRVGEDELFRVWA